MIRGFTYGFIMGFTTNIISFMVFLMFDEMDSYNKEEQEIKIIGLLAGVLCSCIAIGWLVYCFKF